MSESSEIAIGGRVIRVVSAPFFVALKLEAFEDRGEHDFLCSTDFEDVICLFNGRSSIVAEIAAAELLRKFLADKFSAYLTEPDLVDAVDGFVQTEDNPEVRKAIILDRIRSVAGLGR